jgi:hypothetical protein
LRKAFLSPSTVLTFISVDDPAIGVTDDERPAALAQYARTLDQRVLKLTPSVEPTKFFVRVLDAEQKSSVASLLMSDGVGGFAAALQTDLGRLTLRSLLDKNLLGYKNFQLVTGFSDFGEPVITRYDCAPGEGAPVADVTTALLSDLGFMVNLLLFLVTAGQLSDDEKKA